MQYRPFGKTGINISTLGFGCMRLPTLEGTDKIDEQEAVRIIRKGIDSGINYLDTAFFYHNGDFCKRFYNYLLEMKTSEKKLYQMPINTTISFARFPEIEIYSVEMPSEKGRWIVRKKAFISFFITVLDHL